MAGRNDDKGADRASAPPRRVDRAKVDRLQKAIDTGDYLIDPETIAKRLLDGKYVAVVNPK